MNNFVYTNPTTIFFGRGMEEKVGKQVALITEKVLLHYGGQSAQKSGLLDQVRRSLEAAGVACFELGGVQPNPRLELVYEGVKICKENGIGLVLAVGGGSVIDSAKAIACGAPNTDDVWDYFIGKAQPKAVLPVATVLTIPGAGSESSDSLVITNEKTTEKLGYGDRRVRPVFSILNPEYTFTLPPYHTATGVADAFVHVWERYFTNTRNVDVTDRLCEAVMRSLIKFGPMALQTPDDYDIRAEIMWACKMAHDGTLGVGREEDWSTHNIEHELSALYDVAHAAGLTVVGPAWMQYVYPHDKNRFAQFAVRVFDVEYDYAHPERTILAGIERLKIFFKEIGLPTTLRELGVQDKSMCANIAKSAATHGGGSLGYFVTLKEDDICKILELAY